MIGRPELLVADEPTGNVDADMAGRILHLLTALNRLGTTIIVATHVVRSMVLNPGSRVRRATAAESLGFAAIATTLSSSARRAAMPKNSRLTIQPPRPLWRRCCNWAG